MTKREMVPTIAALMLVLAMPTSAAAQQRPAVAPTTSTAAAPADQPAQVVEEGVETANLGTVPFTAQEQLLLRPDDKAAIRKLEDKHVKELRDLEDKYGADLRVLRRKQAEERDALRKTIKR